MSLDALELAEKIRSACIDAALRAYDDAGVQGLCAQGRWEAAVGAMRAVELDGLLSPRADRSPTTDFP